ncbi:protein ALP1-like isoform X2 [Monomorium pharaonis]|uniref:protein ALP1-like isoform X2 n=1 Tax=Monomorium pharaonis TaxID=307658 RepID=UPI00063F153E|nr:protein ALP1-like isoform X2 [Monomorium pharaonis]XP_012525452.1 protein ALP1-like isoform X2 [Monomorium pharaonis]XP_012540239.1 protein ALP1-like isoform X2 [Monomorium pharaonis]XP_028047219.1 protein ALP1-like isoform X2 [Monomorium pharaonis]XP_036147633.1 protein ALP1-like isoform X2 [Monomorium pharaonis]
MDENLALLLWLRRRKRRNRLKENRRTARWWIHPIIRERFEQGAYENLILELRNDPERFFNFHRMSHNQFDQLLAVVESQITKLHVTREPLSAGLRLSLTIRYLASGDSMISLHYLYRIGKSTVPKIITETTHAIWVALMPRVLPRPTAATWAKVAIDFEQKWNFPNCVGAIDVLLGVCDANLRFIYVSIGSAGRESDGGIFRNTDFGKHLMDGTLALPPPKNLPNTNISLPMVFVADAAFPLLTNMMRPYPGTNLTADKTIFNYRLSRARRLIENTFGLMSSRWRIFRKPIIASIPIVENIIKACVVLHNWLINEDLQILPARRRYIPNDLVDREDCCDNTENVIWRVEGQLPLWQNLTATTCRNSSNEAKQVRQGYTKYFMEEGAVDWQWRKIANFEERCL